MDILKEIDIREKAREKKADTSSEKVSALVSAYKNHFKIKDQRALEEQKKEAAKMQASAIRGQADAKSAIASEKRAIDRQQNKTDYVRQYYLGMLQDGYADEHMAKMLGVSYNTVQSIAAKIQAEKAAKAAQKSSSAAEDDDWVLNTGEASETEEETEDTKITASPAVQKKISEQLNGGLITYNQTKEKLENPKAALDISAPSAQKLREDVKNSLTSQPTSVNITKTKLDSTQSVKQKSEQSDQRIINARMIGAEDNDAQGYSSGRISLLDMPITNKKTRQKTTVAQRFYEIGQSLQDENYKLSTDELNILRELHNSGELTGDEKEFVDAVLACDATEKYRQKIKEYTDEQLEAEIQNLKDNPTAYNGISNNDRITIAEGTLYSSKITKAKDSLSPYKKDDGYDIDAINSDLEKKRDEITALDKDIKQKEAVLRTESNQLQILATSTIDNNAIAEERKKLQKIQAELDELRAQEKSVTEEFDALSLAKSYAYELDYAAEDESKKKKYIEAGKKAVGDGALTVWNQVKGDDDTLADMEEYAKQGDYVGMLKYYVKNFNPISASYKSAKERLQYLSMDKSSALKVFALNMLDHTLLRQTVAGQYLERKLFKDDDSIAGERFDVNDLDKEQKERLYYYAGKYADGNTQKFGENQKGAFDWLDSVAQDVMYAKEKEALSNSKMWEISRRLWDGVSDWFASYGSALGNVANGYREDDNAPASSYRWEAAKDKFDLNNFEKFSGDAAYGLGNQLPRMAISGAVNLVAPGMGTYVNAVVFASDVGVQSLNEKLGAGWNTADAATFAALNTAWQTVSERALNAFGLGEQKGFITKRFEKALDKVCKNGYYTAPMLLAVNALQEGFEEFVQDLGETVINNAVASSVDIEKYDWEGAFYDGLIGGALGLSGAVLPATGTAVNQAMINSADKKMSKINPGEASVYVATIGSDVEDKKASASIKTFIMAKDLKDSNDFDSQKIPKKIRQDEALKKRINDISSVVKKNGTFLKKLSETAAYRLTKVLKGVADQDVDRYIKAFEILYEAGKSGKQFDTVRAQNFKKLTMLDKKKAYIAYDAGKVDANHEKNNGANTAPAQPKAPAQNDGAERSRMTRAFGKRADTAEFNALYAAGYHKENIPQNIKLFTPEEAQRIYRAGLIDRGEAGTESINITRPSKPGYINQSMYQDQDNAFESMANAFAELLGVEVRHVRGESIDSEGQFIADLMRIVISDTAKNEVLTLAHEVGEVIYAFNGEGYEKLRSVMMEYLRKQGVDVDKDIDFYQAKYAEKEGTKTRASAEKEYILDTFAGLFATEDGVKSFIECVEKSKAMTTSEKQGLYRAIVDALRKIIDNLKKLIAGNPVDHAGYIVMNATVEKVNEMMKLFVDVISETKDIIDGISDGDVVNVVTDQNTAQQDVALKEKTGVVDDEIKMILENGQQIKIGRDPELVKKINSLRGAEKYNYLRDYIYETLGNSEIEFSDGVKAMVDKSDSLHVARLAKDVANAIISDIRKVVEGAHIYAEDVNVEHKKFDYFRYYKAKIKIGKENLEIYFNVGRGKNDGLFHLYDITKKIRDTANRINGLGRLREFRPKNSISTDNMISQSESVVNNNYMKSSKKYSGKSKNNIKAAAALKEKNASIVRTAHQVDVNLREKNASEARTAHQVDVNLREAQTETERALRLQNQILRNELKRTGGRMKNPTEIKAFARQLLKENRSSYSGNLLAAELIDFYEYVENHKDNISENTISRLAGHIAEHVVSGIRQNSRLTDEVREAIRDFKKRPIALTDSAVIEAKELSGTVGRFKKELSNTFSFRNDGTPIDVWMAEMAEQYPQYFPADLNEGDMPAYLLDLAEDLHSTYMDNDYFLDDNELKEYITGQIIEQRSGISEHVTLAEKIQAGAPAYRMLNEKRKTERLNEIRRIERRLTRAMVKPTEKTFVTDGLRSAVTKVLQLVHTSESGEYELTRQEMQARIQSLNDEYDKTEQSAKDGWGNTKDPKIQDDDGYNEYLARDMADLTEMLSGKQTDRGLSLAELTKLRDIMESLEWQVRSEAYMITNGAAQKIVDVASSVMETARSQKIVGGTSVPILRWFLKSQIYSFNRLYKSISEYDENNAFYKLSQAVVDGNTKAWDHEMRATKLFEPLLKNKKAYFEARKRKEIDGLNLSMSPLEAATIVMTWDREQNAKRMNHNYTPHMEDGGIRILDAKEKKIGDKERAEAIAKDFVMDEKSIALIRDFIADNDYVQEWMDTAKKYWNTLHIEEVNQVLYQLKHSRITPNEYYIPITTVSDHNDGIAYYTASGGSIENPSFTKRQKDKASSSLAIYGLDELVASSIAKTSQYVGLAIPLRNFRRVWNTKTIPNSSIREQFRIKFGTKALNVIEKNIKDLCVGADTTKSGGLWGKLTSNWVESTLSANISVTIKQTPSYFSAGEYLDQSSLLAGSAMMAKYLGKKALGKNIQTLFDEIDEHTPLHWQRRKGMSAVQLAEQFKGITGSTKKALRGKKVLDYYSWITATDVGTTAQLWLACKAQIGKEYKKADKSIGTDAYWNEVTKLYNTVIENTQPMYDSLHRSEVMKNDRLKPLTMFKTQPLQNFGCLADATGQLFVAKRKGDKAQIRKASKKLRMTLLSQMEGLVAFKTLSLVANFTVRSMNGWRDDDKKEITEESIIREYLNSILTGGISLFIPLIGDNIVELFDGIITGVESNNSSFASPGFQAIEDIIDGLIKVWNNPSEDNIRKAVFSVAAALRVPANNLYKSLHKAIYENARAIVEGDFLNYGYDFKDNTQYNRIYDAILNGNQTKADEIISELLEKRVKDRTEFDVGKTDDELRESAEESVHTAIRSRLKDEQEIKQAGQMLIISNYTGYESIVKKWTNKGFDQDDVVAAIRTPTENDWMADAGEQGTDIAAAKEDVKKIKAMGEAIEGALYTKKDVFNAILIGRSSDAEKMKENIMPALIEKMKADDAEKDVDDRRTADKLQEAAEEAIHTTIRTEIKKQSDVAEKAKKITRKDYSEYEKLIKTYVAKGFDQEDVVSAIRSAAGMKDTPQNGCIYSMKDYSETVLAGGSSDTAANILNAIVKSKSADGSKTTKEIVEGLRQSISTAFKSEYLKGDPIVQRRIAVAMRESGLYRSDISKYNVSDTIQRWYKQAKK